MMTTFLTLLTAYWYLPSLALVLLAYVGLRKVAESNAKNVIIKHLQTVENAAATAAKTGAPELAATLYKTLPIQIKAFVPLPVFTALVAECIMAAEHLLHK